MPNRWFGISRAGARAANNYFVELPTKIELVRFKHETHVPFLKVTENFASHAKSFVRCLC